MPRRLLLSGLGLGGVALLGILTANAVSSTSFRSDPPLKSVTFSDPPSDAPNGAPDISAVLVENWSDGTIGFKVSIPRESTLFGNQGIGVYIDTDATRTTGQMGDDYFISVAGQFGGDPRYTLLKWIGTTWTSVAAPSLTGEYRAGDAVYLTIAKSDLGVGIGSTFNFDVWASGIISGQVNSDQAPDLPNYYTYVLGVAPVTTTTTPPTTTSAQQAEKLAGRVGPGATIVFVHSAKTGKATITINDRTAKDNFHLSGKGVNKKTGIAFTGRAVWNVTLAKGPYTFRSDAHASLHGTLKVS